MRCDISLREARELVAGEVLPLSPASVPVFRALGCRVTADIVARVDCPSDTVASKDGFAVRAADLVAASDAVPVLLRRAGQVFAGQQELPCLEPGNAVEVMTGARLPAGADAVLPSETVEATVDAVRCPAPIDPGRNLLAAGADVRAGTVIVREGQVLRPAACGLLAAAGLAAVPCLPKPAVAVLATGDELVEPGRPLAFGQVYASNLVTLLSWMEHLGLPRTGRIVPDRLDAIMDAMKSLLDTADALFTCGGAWKSGRDLTLSALEGLGWRPVFQRVRMGPGKAVSMGHLNGKPVFCLPGGPPSNEMAFLQLALPGILRMAPWMPPPFREVEAVLSCDIDGGTPGWTRFYQASLVRRDGDWQTTPLQSRRRLQTQADAEAVVEVAEGVVRIQAGTRIPVLQLFPGKENS